MKRTAPIEVEVGGQVYHGARIVSGEHNLRQEIRYEELRQQDPNDYVPGDEAFMRAIATVMLRELVEQWRARGTRTPVKVEPKKGRRRRRRKAGS